MTNEKNLTQLNNQEAIVEEINEEELEGVVGGFLEDLLGSVGFILDNTLFGLASGIGGVTAPRQ
ncbi:hypothetical protein [Nostoc sp. MG11]|uniref:hypothetical protein n=1 Tax=Nostoc sp. MG11 TaxID=2721166 RepID=UPI001868EC3F|nr:hypothetical protein [Nostoc sp. MG11]